VLSRLNRVKEVQMNILCVENEPENLALLTCMLEGIGYDVTPATSGDQALDLFINQEKEIDGVLLEYNLPHQTGAEVRAQLKMIQPEVPVLLLEAMPSETPSVVRSLVRSFDAYLRNAERSADGCEELEL
jgi:CheY-like chemotaxis protein